MDTLKKFVFMDVLHVKVLRELKDINSSLYALDNIEDYEIIALLMRDVIVIIRKVYDFLDDVEKERVKNFFDIFSEKYNIDEKITEKDKRNYSYNEDMLLSVSLFYQNERILREKGIDSLSFTHTSFCVVKTIVMCILFKDNGDKIHISEGLIYISKYFDSYENILLDVLLLPKARNINVNFLTYEQLLTECENDDMLDKRLLALIKKIDFPISILNENYEAIHSWKECECSFAMLDELFDNNAVIECRKILECCYEQEFECYRNIIKENPYVNKKIVFEEDENKKNIARVDELFGKYALVNDEGKLVTKYIYDDVEEEFSGNKDYIKVCKNGKFGWIRRKDMKCITPQFDNIMSNDETWLKVSKGQRCYLVDYDNNCIFEKFDDYDDIKLLWGQVLVKKEGKWGLVTKENEICLPIVYDKLYRGSELSPQKDMLLIGELESQNMKLVFDKEFNIIMTFDINTEITIYKSDKYKYILKNGKVGYFNEQGTILVPALYEYCELYNSFICIGSSQNRKIVFLSNFDVLNIRNDQFVNEINNNLLQITEDYSITIINTTTFDKFEYESQEVIFADESVILEGETENITYALILEIDNGEDIGKLGVIDLECNNVLPFEYDYISNKLIKDKKSSELYYDIGKEEGDKYLFGLSDSKGNILFECRYNNICQDDEGNWILEENGCKYIADSNGVIKEQIFDK